MYHLLVVDDEAESRNTLCNCFPWNTVGFEVTAQAGNGAEALDLIRHNKIDVVLCDIKMPGLSGIDLAQELYQHKPRPAIIFLSGYRDFEYAQKALTFGVRYYIVKPARYEEIMTQFQMLKQELDAQRIALETTFHAGNDGKPSDSTDFQAKIVEMVKSYIQANYAAASLEEASKLVHLNASYLSQLFKQKTGVNFSDYLIEIKMTKAAELLMDYELKTYAVSEMVGYTNAKNFARTFKSFYGVNPRDYRYAKLGKDLPEG
ncbi:helix-turn-helix protein [Hydrogenispora ethanolica]|jgi:YesN/AraC family two-component response regulator|uniref:Helix-turn-helix protein n=1 Tax=Hydrogenispora ethanolica TaxID=1082276 RepID=A0A4R1QZD8_HYDET|nr:response regulator [Hydrogenispora ethanolica]TCL58348.1 helix-turn-helix protein [Hydrogenispora ethanolica]